MTAPELIENAFTTLAAGVAGVASAYDYEPGEEGLGKLPCVTMLYLGPRRVSQSTGGFEDLEYTWEILLYVSLKGWATAQSESRDLVSALKVAVKNDHTLGQTCDMAHLLDELARPEFLPGADTRTSGEMLKRLRLTAQKESF